MTRVLAILAVCALAFASSALAQGSSDDVLRAVDELMTLDRCPAALALLEHATGTPAEIAGRRGICEARTGLTGPAAAHIAEALRAPSDPWVVAHHDALLAALSAAPPPAPPAPVTEPTFAPPLPAITRAPATETPSAHVQMDATFLERFGRAPPADVPVARIPPRLASRTTLRLMGAIGATGSERLSLGSSPYASSGRYQSDRISFDEYEDGEAYFRADVGVEIERLFTGYFSLFSELDVGIGFDPVGSSDVSRRRHLGSLDGPFGGREYIDYANGTMRFGPAISMRALVGTRLHLASGKLVLGLGVRGGFVRVHGEAGLREAEYLDLDSHAPGTREGSVQRWAGGPTFEGVLDVGLGLGVRHDVFLLMRTSGGVPNFGMQLVALIPLYRSAR